MNDVTVQCGPTGVPSKHVLSPCVRQPQLQGPTRNSQAHGENCYPDGTPVSSSPGKKRRRRCRLQAGHESCQSVLARTAPSLLDLANPRREARSVMRRVVAYAAAHATNTEASSRTPAAQTVRSAAEAGDQLKHSKEDYQEITTSFWVGRWEKILVRSSYSTVRGA